MTLEIAGQNPSLPGTTVSTRVPQLHPIHFAIRAVVLGPAALPGPHAPRCSASRRLHSPCPLTDAIGHGQEVDHEGGFVHVRQDGVVQNDENFLVKASGQLWRTKQHRETGELREQQEPGLTKATQKRRTTQNGWWQQCPTAPNQVLSKKRVLKTQSVIAAQRVTLQSGTSPENQLGNHQLVSRGCSAADRSSGAEWVRWERKAERRRTARV